MKKRDMFAELSEGLEALKQEREGKITLKSSEVTLKPRPTITAAEIVQIREKLGVSRPVFAGMIRTSPRTIERWEQDKCRSDQGSVTLLKLVERYPDTLDRLAEL